MISTAQKQNHWMCKMRMKAVREIAEGLHRDHAARKGLGFGNRALEKGLQRLPSTAAQLGQKPAVTEEEATENLGNTHDEVPVRDGPKHVSAEPLPEFHYTFLMTGRTEVPSLAGKGQHMLFVLVTHTIRNGGYYLC